MWLFLRNDYKRKNCQTLSSPPRGGYHKGVQMGWTRLHLTAYRPILSLFRVWLDWQISNVMSLSGDYCPVSHLPPLCGTLIECFPCCGSCKIARVSCAFCFLLFPNSYTTYTLSHVMVGPYSVMCCAIRCALPFIFPLPLLSRGLVCRNYI